MTNPKETCKNCEQVFTSGFNFCPHCGQKTKDELTLGVLFYNTISNYFSFDARFLKSFFPLVFKPGYLAKCFVEGKRLLYLHPAQLYLFISVVFFFILSVTVVRDQVQDLDTNLKKTLDKPLISKKERAVAQSVIDSIPVDSILNTLKDSNIPGMDQLKTREIDSLIKTNAKKDNNNINFVFDEEKIDSLLAVGATNDDIYKAMGMDYDANSLVKKFYAQVLKFYTKRNGGQILQAIYDTIPISLFVLLPIFALILKLLFFRRGRYAHHLVFSFYFFSFLFTVFSIVLLVNQAIDIPDWMDWLVVLSTFFYLLIGIKRFYRHGWFLSFFKTGVATFVYLMFVIPVAAVIVAGISFFFY